jgi:hypothetical protein
MRLATDEGRDFMREGRRGRKRGGGARHEASAAGYAGSYGAPWPLAWRGVAAASAQLAACAGPTRLACTAGGRVAGGGYSAAPPRPDGRRSPSAAEGKGSWRRRRGDAMSAWNPIPPHPVPQGGTPQASSTISACSCSLVVVLLGCSGGGRIGTAQRGTTSSLLFRAARPAAPCLVQESQNSAPVAAAAVLLVLPARHRLPLLSLHAGPLTPATVRGRSTTSTSLDRRARLPTPTQPSPGVPETDSEPGTVHGVLVRVQAPRTRTSCVAYCRYRWYATTTSYRFKWLVCSCRL